MKMSIMATRPKDYGQVRKLMDRLSNHLSIINDHQNHKDNNKALKVIAIIEDAYENQKIFDKEFFDFLDLLDSGQLNTIITREIKNSDDYESFANLYFKGVYEAIQLTAILIRNQLPLHNGLSLKCTNVYKSHDVVVIEMGQYKITLLRYENKFRLLHLHNRYTKRTTLFKNSFFETSDEMYTYMNNIEEYAEFNGDVLDMIKC